MPADYIVVLKRPRCDICNGVGAVWEERTLWRNRCTTCEGWGWGYLVDGVFVAPDKKGECPVTPKPPDPQLRAGS